MHIAHRWNTGEGKSPISRSSASRRCRCCGGGGGGGGYNTSLYVILCVRVCVCMRRRLSLFCDIRFPNSPHSVRGATERKHLDILEYEHCVNIRSVLSSLFLSISSVRVSRVLHLDSCVSLFFFFLMRVLRVGQRYDRWNHSHSSRAYRAFRWWVIMDLERKMKHFHCSPRIETTDFCIKYSFLKKKKIYSCDILFW